MDVSIYTVCLSLVVTISVALNGVILAKFIFLYKNLKFRDFIIFSLAISDFSQALLGYPLELSNNGLKSVLSNVRICYIAGFIVAWCGITSITHLVVLSFDRYLSICHPFRAYNLHHGRRRAIPFSVASWFYAFIWTALPFTGLSRYKIEGQLFCSLDWSSKNTSNVTYVSLLFVFCFLAPVVFMVFTYICTTRELAKMRQLTVVRTAKSSVWSRTDMLAERRNSRMVSVMILAFLIGWTPYAIISVMQIYGKSKLVTVKINKMASVLAKASCTFNPIIYSIISKKFRTDVLLMLKKCFGQRNRLKGNNKYSVSTSRQKDSALSAITYV